MPFPLTGSLAILLLLICFAGVTSRLPQAISGPYVSLIAAGCCLVASSFAAKSSNLPERVIGKIVLVVLVILVLSALLLPAV
jgi:hypothetical protein